MMLYKYISDLLYRYECVIIPEFGGLLTKTTSTKIDEETNTFYPPTKQLGFNSQLIENDGLLANHIASVDKVPYETALNFIKFEVSGLQEKLKKQDVTLENIGTFSLNPEGVVIFEPDPNSNFLTDTFGLNTIVSPIVMRDEILEEEITFDSISDVIAADEIAVNTESVKREISPFFKYAATIALLVALIAVFSKQILDNNKLGKTISGLEADQETRVNNRIQEATFEISSKLPDITIQVKNQQEIVAETYELDETNNESVSIDNNIEENPPQQKVKIKQDRIDKALANQISENETNEYNVKTKDDNQATTTMDVISKPEINTTYRYHIIAGAFREPTNADKKVRQLKAKGYDAKKVGINKWQLTQVAFGSYATKQEAQQVLRDIKKSEAKDAWMLVK
jgi:cell division protein FtsN